jgi:SnoaL-like domain
MASHLVLAFTRPVPGNDEEYKTRYYIYWSKGAVMLSSLTIRLLIGTALIVLGGSAMAQTDPTFAQKHPDAMAWREKTLNTFRDAKPTPALAKMPAVDKLLAIEEIRQIPYKYCRCINQRDWDCWTNLFAPDADYWNSKLGVVKGPSGMYQHLVATGMTSSRVHSLFVVLGGPEIDLLSPTTARGVFQEEYTFSSGATEAGDPSGTVVVPGQETRSFGVYYQTYEKIDGKWKIKSNIHLDLRNDKGPLSSGTTFVDSEAPPNPK